MERISKSLLAFRIKNYFGYRIIFNIGVMKAEEIRIAKDFLNNLYGIGDKDHESGLEINHYLGAISDLVKRNKELVEENKRLKQTNSDRQLRIERLIDKSYN